MKLDEKTRLLELMDGGVRAFQDAVKSVPESLAKRRPEPQRWSALECAEHVAIAEESLFSRIASAKHADTPAVNEQRESEIMATYANRSERFQAPQPVQPTGRFSTLDEALAQFLKSRERTIRFIGECQDDLRSEVTTHSRLGSVNCYEVLLLMAMHPRRHAAQIREIQAALAPHATAE